MNRRTAWLGGAAVVATGCGISAGWWQSRRASAVPEADLWSLRFARPQGGAPLELAALRGKPLLLNFWAPWCAPCVSEMPLLDRFGQQQPAWHVVGLAVDQPDPVQHFLSAHPVSFSIGLAGLDGIDLASRLGNTSGGLPFSLVFASDGKVAGQRLGALRSDDLHTWEKSVH